MVAPRGVGGVVRVAAEVLVEELGRGPEGAGAAEGLARSRPVSTFISGFTQRKVHLMGKGFNCINK